MKLRLLLTAALLAAACSEPGGAAPPSVLWISLDTLRADRLSCYGNEHETSPAIDRLAREGALFERALSVTSWTLPSHVSMLTGLPVSAHGVCFESYGDRPTPLRGTYVSEVLSERGYATAGFYSHKYLAPELALGGGFDVWERTGKLWHRSQELRAEWEAAEQRGDKAEARRVRKEHNALFKDASRFEADDGVDRAIGWLEEHLGREPERPFLLFLHVFDVHSPYDPPEPWNRHFDPDYDGPLERVVVDAEDSIVSPGIAPEALERVLNLYDGEIAWVDSQIARLLSRLEELERADDTLIVLTSDHGEEFLEHGQNGHRKELFVESLHVPLILRLPGRLPVGVRVSTPVSILDLAPTVYALLDVPPPAGLPGIDLAALARGELAPPERVLVGELTVVSEQSAERALSLYSANEHVLVHQLGLPDERIQRYDLRADPLELAPPEQITAGSEVWVALQARIEQQRARLHALRSSARPREGAMAIDELDRSELEALGYAGTTQEAGEDHGRLCIDGCVWGDP